MGKLRPRRAAGEERDPSTAEQLAAIVRSSDDAILAKDRNARITSWNRGAERLYGWKREEMLGRPVALLIPPDRHGEEHELLARVLAGEQIEHYETERVAKDGTRIEVSLTLSPIHSVSGEIIGASSQARDVGTRKRIEREIADARDALEEAEQRFRSAFHEAPIGMAVVNVAEGWLGPLHEFNRSLAELLRYTDAEFAATTLDELSHPEDAPGEGQLVDELLARRRRSYGVEKRMRRSDGDWVWAWVTVSLLHGDGAPRWAIVHVLDITERKESEQELARARENLERSNAELDQFAYVASHDLKEPLILVSAYARMLEERHLDALDEDGRTFVANLREETGRMKAMIDDLLDYSRLETRAGDAVAVDLAEAAATAVHTLGPRLEDAGASIEIEPPLPTVTGSPTQFERLFRNLFSNAVKFRSEDPPRIRVTCAERDGEWIVSVRDNGIGIDPAKAERVFELFQRLHGQEAYAGTGMGLAICKRVVERHGGRIWVEPAAQGGSVFAFALPR